MTTHSDRSRRRFLRQSFAFSAAAALGYPLTGCGTTLNGLSPSTKTEGADLLMLGDWGNVDSTKQSQVAAAMKSYIQSNSLNLQALLMLGDNFYGPLPGGASDSRWHTGFELMYPADIFNCPAYAIPGNHDYELSPGNKYTAEKAYAQLGNTRWTMPDQYYSFLFPETNPLITVIALDSNMPFANGDTRHGSFICMTEEQRKAQLAWLTDELAKPLTTPFRAVIGHHPLYSNGPHGDNSILIRDWDPLLRQYKVHLYLGGHDHDLQHLEFDSHPTSFFLSGGGGAALYSLKISEDVRGPYAQSTYGFSHLHATETLLTLHHLDIQGNPIHSFTKDADGNVTLLS